MNEVISKELSKALRQAADKLDSNTCEFTDEQASQLLNIICHVPVSKETASSHLNISRSRFDELIKEGRLPKGKKRRGFKELVWWLDELKVKKK